jgi:hypothetical protein
MDASALPSVAACLAQFRRDRSEGEVKLFAKAHDAVSRVFKEQRFAIHPDQPGAGLPIRNRK